jgi:ribosomal protein S18 acetylase RimI-like enzyme
MEFKPFSEQHITTAANLLVHQNKNILRRFPLLPERIAEMDATREFLTALLQKPDSHGMVLEQNGKLIAYMLGSYNENPFFGKHCWVPLGGIALPRNNIQQVFRHLYAATGVQWMRDGVLNHYLVCPDLHAWQQAAFSLSFGREQAYAVNSLQKPLEQPDLPAGIQIRLVVPQDANQLFDIGHWIAAHLNKEPVWEPVPQQHLDAILPEYAKLANDDTSTTMVAVEGEKIVGYVVLYTVDVGPDHLLGVPSAGEFAAAAIDPDYRKRGVGRALFTRLINEARQQKYKTLFTDWRTTNLVAASYWPSFGFETFAYRLLRRVNPRYQPFVEK